MRFIIILLSLLITIHAHAVTDCTELLSRRLTQLYNLDRQGAEKSVVVNNHILLGKTSGWTFWRKKNPWKKYEGERVTIAQSDDNKRRPQLIVGNQTILNYADFVSLIPEVHSAMDSILSLSRSTGNEWGFAVYVIRDPNGIEHLVLSQNMFTSSKENSINYSDTMVGMVEALRQAKAEVGRGGNDSTAWEVREMWLVHTHPTLYSPLSLGDIRAAETIHQEDLRGSLRFRMIAVTTNDPTVFSIVHSDAMRAVRYVIHPINGWTMEKVE